MNQAEDEWLLQPSLKNHTASLLPYYFGPGNHEGPFKFKGTGHRLCLLTGEWQGSRRGQQVLLQPPLENAFCRTHAGCCLSLKHYYLSGSHSSANQPI